MKLLILTLPLLIVWTIEGSDVRDSLNLRVFNKDLAISDAEMHKLLKKGNLEGHGYQKEVTTTLTRKPGSSVPDYVKTYFYYKVVLCGKVLEVEEELDRLLDGAFGSSVARKARNDVKERKITSGRQCRVGAEIHFRNEQNCNNSNISERGCNSGGSCGICFRVAETN